MNMNMKIINWFNKRLLRNKRDIICPDTISTGTILKTYPGSRSHVTKPYLLRVIDSNKESFTTELVCPKLHKDPHTHTFVYGDASWEYHRKRFLIIKK